MAAPQRHRIGILGTSGYTGAKLLRLLAYHPAVEIAALTADRQAGRPIGAVFPHLAPGATPGDQRHVLEYAYWGEPFVRVVPDGNLPAMRHVRGTNLCLIGLAADRAILMSAEDNLVEGASGQTIQNMNLMLGLPETTALEHRALFP